MSHYDAIIVGAGVNALVAAGYLTSAGKKVILLERRPFAGGCLAEEPLGSSRLPLATPSTPALRPGIGKTLNLEYYGLQFTPHDPVVLVPGDKPITLWREVDRAVASIATHSRRDAARYREYGAFMKRVVEALSPLLDQTPVPPDTTQLLDMLDLANLGVRVRRLSQDDLRKVMRMATMSLRDFLDEWFETPGLKAALAAPGLSGHFYGPRAPGTAATLLYNALAGPLGRYEGLAETLASVVKDQDGELLVKADVEQILVENGAAVGVRLADGQELRARVVISGADPKRTLLSLLDPLDLGPGFRRQVKQIRMRGTTSVISLVLSGTPQFRGADDESALGGRIHLGPDLDVIERASDAAKYGVLPEHPMITATLRGQVLQLEVRWTPYDLADGDWQSRREELLERAVETVERYAPGLSGLITENRVLTPVDLEKTYGLTGGHVHHGEHNLHQLFFGRPIGGWSRYNTPVRNLFLCGSGTHPGGGATGASGANAARELLASSGTPLKKATRAVATPVGASLAVGAGLALLGTGLVVSAALKGRNKPKKEVED